MQSQRGIGQRCTERVHDMSPDTETKKEDKNPAADLQIKGRFKSYNSPFLEVMIPALTMRYVWLALEDINPFNFLKKPDPRFKPGFKEWVPLKTLGAGLSRNFASIGVGATLLGILAYYSKSTQDDMKTLYAEAVGYELDKKPEDVTLNDIMSKSDNAALKVTRGAFVRRTIARAAAIGSFFIPWHMARDFHHNTPKYDANLNAGVGALGTYLTLDGFIRKPSFFDEEQSLVHNTVTPEETSVHEVIRPKNVQTLLLLQRRHIDSSYRWPEAVSEEGKNELRLATRIADLLNQTYNNTPKQGEANFTIGKFNFLVGFGLLDHFPESMAFVELANRSTDMRDVKDASAALQKGEPAQAVFARYGVDVAALAKEKEEPTLASGATTDKTFSAQAKRQPHTALVAPRSHQDFANQTQEVNHVIL